jgi:shikimate dehydrogenase
MTHLKQEGGYLQMIERITGHTILTGLLGSPVSHSISPMMHNESFKLLNLDYAYLAFDVGTDNLKTAIEGLKVLGVRGFNLTMPDKNLMFELADKLSPAAELIGAVNTVVNDNGILTGHNTDGVGYMHAVKDAGFDISGKKMTLLGAGGAATAVCVQAALDGVSEIDVFSIKDQFFDRATQLIDNINSKTNCKASLFELPDDTTLRKSISESYIVTNGTSVGMSPNVDNSIINDITMLHSDLIVSDIIYNPQKTKFLSLSEDAGCSTFNGMYMLLYQGAEAFKLWTGQEMPSDIIKEKFFK